MNVTLEIPDEVAAQFRVQGDDLSRHALEALAVDGYRTGLIGEESLRKMLGLASRFEVHALLLRHRVPLNYLAEDLEADLATARELGLLAKE